MGWPEIEKKPQADLRFLVVEPRGLEPLTPCLQNPPMQGVRLADLRKH
jgi:hypothetical protein